MDDAFLMGVLDGIANGDEEREALGGRQVFLIALFGEGYALDELHDKIGATFSAAPDRKR